MLVEGNVAAVKTFPSVTVRQLNNYEAQSKVYEIFCSGRQQLISAGRTHVLQYTYFWKEALDQAGSSPAISVTDLAGLEVAPGETDILPCNRTLRFKSMFEGNLVLSSNGHVIDKRKIFPDKYIELEELSYGLSVQVIIGLDVIWQIRFTKRRFINLNTEPEVLKRISSVSSASIPVPHSLRNISLYMNKYPRVRMHIQKCINNGAISKRSYRELQNLYRIMNLNRKEDAL